MERRIVRFRQDDEGGWIAELDCAHTQHVRHDPPWQERPWVIDAVLREARVGSLLECGRCTRDAQR